MEHRDSISSSRHSESHLFNIGPSLVNRSTLLGNAPKLSVLKRRGGDNAFDKHIKAASFWYVFRRLFPIISTVSIVLGFIIPNFTAHDVDSFLLSGSIISMIFSILAIVSYHHIAPWRRHPSDIILHRTYSTLIFTCIILAYAVKNYSSGNNKDISPYDLVNVSSDTTDHSTTCQTSSVFTQYSVLSGELWVFMLSLDLYFSLTNPFTSYKANLQRYRMSTWIFSFVLSLLLLGQKSCQGVFFANGICWLKASGPLSPCLWGYFLTWCSFFYLSSIAVIVFAFTRLSTGLEVTYETRKACVMDTFRVVFCYMSYAIVIAILYLVLSFKHEGLLGRVFERLIVYIVACRGTVDAFVWFYLHDFCRDTSSLHIVDRIVDFVYFPMYSMRLFSNPLIPSDLDDRMRATASNSYSTANDMDTEHNNKHSGYFGFGYGAATRTKRSLTGTSLNNQLQRTNTNNNIMLNYNGNNNNNNNNDDSGDAIDVDLSPQLNMALRAELLHYVSGGIQESLQRTHERELKHQMLIQDQARILVENVSRNGNNNNANNHNNHHNQNTNNSGSIRSHSHGSQSQSESIASRSNIHTGAGYATPEKSKPQSNNQSTINTTNALDTPINSPISTYGDNGVPNNNHSTSNMANTAYTTASSPYYPRRRLSSSSYNLRSSIHRMVNMVAEKIGITHEAETYSDVHPREDVFIVEGKHEFRDYEPGQFLRLRQLCNINEEWYSNQISQPTKEKLAEGASGAFMFYCGHEDLFVKTVSKVESQTLLRILDDYIDYIQNNPDSLLVRFLGLHSLTMFQTEFTFVVMKNIFPSDIIINERYDVKGSWVKRNAKQYPPGKRTTCRFCSELFMVGSQARCPEVVGPHEANIIFKDNDLTSKIRLQPDDAYHIIDTLNRDSDALCRMGITDYSLLLGVKNQQYDVSGNIINSQRGGGSISSGGGNGTSGTNTINYYNINSVNANNITNTINSAAAQGNATSITPNTHNNSNTNMNNTNNTNNITSRPQRSMTLTSRTSMAAAVPEDPTLGSQVAVINLGSGGYAARAVVAPVGYYFGVIDILETWSIQKRLEYLWKVYFLGLPSAGISCMDPEGYRNRFQSKVSQIIEHSIFVREITGSWTGRREVTEPTIMLNKDDNNNNNAISTINTPLMTSIGGVAGGVSIPIGNNGNNTNV